MKTYKLVHVYDGQSLLVLYYCENPLLPSVRYVLTSFWFDLWSNSVDRMPKKISVRRLSSTLVYFCFYKGHFFSNGLGPGMFAGHFMKGFRVTSWVRKNSLGLWEAREGAISCRHTKPSCSPKLKRFSGDEFSSRNLVYVTAVFHAVWYRGRAYEFILKKSYSKHDLSAASRSP